MQPVEPKFLNK